VLAKVVKEKVQFITDGVQYLNAQASIAMICRPINATSMRTIRRGPLESFDNQFWRDHTSELTRESCIVFESNSVDDVVEGCVGSPSETALVLDVPVVGPFLCDRAGSSRQEKRMSTLMQSPGLNGQ
jgi:hypothetical protein